MTSLSQTGQKITGRKSKDINYFELYYMPHLFKHMWLPVWFVLTFGAFGIKYTTDKQTDHLMKRLKRNLSQMTSQIRI